MTSDQAMVDAIRAMFGLRSLYASEERSLEVRMTRALSFGFTDGNSQLKGEVSHGGRSVLVTR